MWCLWAGNGEGEVEGEGGVLRKLPAVCREEEMDCVVFEVGARAQVGVNHDSYGGRSVCGGRSAPIHPAGLEWQPI